MTWADFVQAFGKKNYSVAVLETKVDEFVTSVQGNLSVTDYAHKFHRLDKFVPEVVPTEALRVQWFMRGLKPMISRNVKMTSAKVVSYAKILDKALEAKYFEDRIWKDNAARREANRNKGFHEGNKRKANERQNSGTDKRPRPATINNNNHNSHNHHNNRHSHNNDRNRGNHQNNRVEHPSSSIAIESRECPVDLVELDIPDYDAILGMDWLSKHGVTIDYRKKTVEYRIEERELFSFKGEHGCSKFLDSVVDKSKEIDLKPKNVHIICEVPEVFLVELLGLPLDKEIEFMIELAPETTLVSKSPYPMALTELKELKTQLQEE
ncbi:uncharacterized protein LOC133779843 [Humulus lupulus]|uniref:uncharacterized protein LOC133779843 n=1 Tax=Humulus lupulus TaxID=3486 RepID=UPI002B407028|nr:uncharacterized protein LOC133779843 [Humulus lupulus]